MKLVETIAPGLAIFTALVEGHYRFTSAGPNGSSLKPFQYVRQNTNHNSPVTDLNSKDLRCNVGGSSGANTQTMTIAAGRNVTWGMDQAVYHQGPISFYMTKVQNAKSADGSTPWFKIRDIGPSKGGNNWTKAMSKSFTVQIPSCLPSSDYLLRIQSMAIHNPGGAPQFYVSCAQVHVTGSGSRSPPSDFLVKIPGAFKKSDPGYKANIYNNFNPSTYKIPGPKEFKC